MNARIQPDYSILHVLSALRFHEADEQGLRSLAKSNWPSLLDDTDQRHLTLPLAVRCRSLFPRDGRCRLDRALTGNAFCHARVVRAYSEIAGLFKLRGVDFLVLKGLAQWPWYVDDPRYREQSDIDIYCQPQSLEAARAALAELGYEMLPGAPHAAVDHLPVMIRRTGWTWRGDYFDPERPPSVELHFRFWDPATEGFSAGDPDAFWSRREMRDIGGIRIPTLSLADGLAYSAMHLVRHLLRGDLQARHAYELAHFLERSAGDNTFWAAWEKSGSPPPRLVEAIAFRLATQWFRCQPHSAALRAMEEIPDPVRRWFDLFGLSPAIAAAQPNKDELWLHLCLVSGAAARRRIMIRRLFPRHRQRIILDPHVTEGQGSASLPARRFLFAAWFLMRRALHHFMAFGSLIRSSLRWWKASAAPL